MADSTIGSLPAASEITSSDLFVLEQNGEAKKLLGSILENYLNRNILDVSVSAVAPTENPTVDFDAATGTLEIGLPRGLGIANVQKTSTTGLIDTYTITLDKLPSQQVATSFTFVVTNAKSINRVVAVSAAHTPGTLDTYNIEYNDGTTSPLEIYNGANGTHGVSISSIRKKSGTGAGGSTDVYEVVLSNGEVGGEFSVYNGSDGQGAPGSALPLMNGTAAVGISEGYSREDHVHPTDTTRQATNIYRTNVSASSWEQQSTPTYSGYGYRCAIPITDVTANMFAIVVFAPAQVVSGNYAPVCDTYAGGVYVYSKVNTAITIPTIAVLR